MNLYLPTSLQQPFKGILFDLDGTLIDSEGMHYAAFKQALSEYGYDLDSLGDAIQYGGSFRRMFEAIALKFNLADDLFESIYLRKVEITLETPATNVEMIEGVASFLELLQERGVPMGVVTNSELAYVEHALNGFDLAQFFNHIVHADLVANPKPAPDGYHYGAKLLRQPANELLVFENTDAGISAAKTAGMQVIAIRSTDHLGVSTYDEADLTIDDFADPALNDLNFTA